jgi:sulfite reductase alpha subunit-like flavoprotein
MNEPDNQQTIQPFIDQLQKWGCQVLRAVNRPNPYRGGFSILFRCDDATARAISDLGIAQIHLDIRAHTYLLRLPEINIDATPGDHPAILPWNEVTKQKKLDELLELWKNCGDIVERRKQRLGLFYKT